MRTFLYRTPFRVHRSLNTPFAAAQNVAVQKVFSGHHASSDTDCILTFSLGLSVPTLRRFCRLRSTIWCDMYIFALCKVGGVYTEGVVVERWINISTKVLLQCTCECQCPHLLYQSKVTVASTTDGLLYGFRSLASSSISPGCYIFLYLINLYSILYSI